MVRTACRRAGLGLWRRSHDDPAPDGRPEPAATPNRTTSSRRTHQVGTPRAPQSLIVMPAASGAAGNEAMPDGRSRTSGRRHGPRQEGHARRRDYRNRPEKACREAAGFRQAVLPRARAILTHLTVPRQRTRLELTNDMRAASHNHFRSCNRRIMPFTLLGVKHLLQRLPRHDSACTEEALAPRGYYEISRH